MPNSPDVENKESMSSFTDEEIALIKSRREAMKGLEHVRNVGYLMVEQCTRIAPAYTYEGKDYPESLRLDLEKFAILLTKAGGKYKYSKKGWKSGGELLIEKVKV